MPKEQLQIPFNDSLPFARQNNFSQYIKSVTQVTVILPASPVRESVIPFKRNQSKTFNHQRWETLEKRRYAGTTLSISYFEPPPNSPLKPLNNGSSNSADFRSTSSVPVNSNLPPSTSLLNFSSHPRNHPNTGA